MQPISRVTFSQISLFNVYTHYLTKLLVDVAETGREV